MQIRLTVENKNENNTIDARESASLSVDSLSTKLKHNVTKQKGQYFVCQIMTIEPARKLPKPCLNRNIQSIMQLSLEKLTTSTFYS